MSQHQILYALIMTTAIASGAWLLSRAQQRLPLEPWQRWSLALGAFCGAMIGAKLPFALADMAQGATHFVWLANGKTIVFGLVGGYLGVEIAKWICEVQTKTGDSFALAAAVSIGIGRLGCYVAGCCYGAPTHQPWGVVFANVDQQLRHPTQLYELIFHFSMAGLLIWIAHKNWLVGQRFKAYLIAYLAFRCVSEWVRPEPRAWLDLTIYQWACLTLIPVFAWLWWRDARRASLFAETAPQTVPV